MATDERHKGPLFHSGDGPDLIAGDMPEVERLALISVRDGGPISEALLSKLFHRLLIKSVRVGRRLNPRIEHRLTPLGIAVVAHFPATAQSDQRTSSDRKAD